jgi:ankyrin repeat protein
MKKILFAILIGFNSINYAQNAKEFPVLKGDYLGQTFPGDTPVVFARGIVSTDLQNHGAPSFSTDGNEIKKEVFNSKLSPKEIHDAAAAGDLNKVKALLEADPTLLESKDDRLSYLGNTPLISACWGPPSNIPQVAVANFLIDKGANIHARNDRKATPLYFSVKDFDLTQRLISMGTDVNIRAYGDFTPLHMCNDIKIARLLIDHGADPNANGSEGTVIQFLIRMNRADEQLIKVLIEGGAKLNQNFGYGNTELHMAVFMGLTNVIPILVRYGSEVDAVNEYGHTPLYYAAMHGYRKVADALITAGAKKNTIIESNYDKALQLRETLRKGEAYLWYLGGKTTPLMGYAVKTNRNLLIFNPTEIVESPGAGLANGYLNPNELSGLKITSLILYKSYQGPFDRPSVSELAKRLSGTNFVLNFKPTPDTAYNNYLPLYKLASPRESFSIGSIQVHTIPAIGRAWFAGEGLSYLVEADGVKIFHAGLHVPGNNASDVENYRKEIDFLKPFGPIDIVILPVNGNHVWWINYESYYYLIDQLLPKAIYLIGDGSAKDEHKKCIEILKARNVPVFYPEGGIAVGERFHYLRER